MRGLVATVAVGVALSAAAAARADLALSPPQLVGVGATPNQVAVADLDGNGLTDIVVANGGTASVIRLADGNGGFTAGTAPGFGGAPLVSVAVADFTGDGNPDIIESRTPPSFVRLLVNNGSASFTGLDPESTAFVATSLVTGDISGDGKPDAVAIAASPGVVIPLTNDANSPSGLTAGSARGVPGAGLSMLADLNGTGALDLAAPATTNSRVFVFGNPGLGALAGSPVVLPSNPSAVAAGDIDGDGDQDLAVAMKTTGDVTLLTNNGTGTFTVAGTTPVQDSPASVALADLDLDGHLDLVTSSTTAVDPSVDVRRGTGTGTFLHVPGYPLVLPGTAPQVLVANMDSDLAPDVVVIARDANSVAILHNRNPASTADKTSLQFGAAPTGVPSAPQTVTVKNTGGVVLTGAATLTGPDRNEFLIGDGCSQLAPAATCTVTVRFAPSVVAPDTATLTVHGHAVTLSGTGATPPTGDTGPQGPAGQNGTDGAIGVQGTLGPTGPDGIDGVTGPVGAAGPAGPTGAKGPIGPAGTAGADGTQGDPGPAGPAGVKQTVSCKTRKARRGRKVRVVCKVSVPGSARLVRRGRTVAQRRVAAGRTVFRVVRGGHYRLVVR